MSRHLCLTKLIIFEELLTGITDQGEPVDVVHLNLSKDFDSVCHLLLFKRIVSMGSHMNIM